MRRAVGLGLTVLFTVGCTDDKSPAQSSRAAAAQAGRAARLAPGSSLSGTVREQIPVGPYVYLRLETANGEEWAAVNEAPVQVGEPVTVYNVMMMEQFASETLKRTFARIYFGSTNPNAGAGTSGQAPSAGAAMGGAAMPAPGASGASPGTPAAATANVGTIARAAGANARTIGELFAQQATLSGKPVSVRGVVVKYNPGVMGKNWIHLQDGSGDAARSTHDLTVTSNETAALGDTVTVTGTVRTNKDFGAGYVYPLVVEEAKVVRK